MARFKFKLEANDQQLITSHAISIHSSRSTFSFKSTGIIRLIRDGYVITRQAELFIYPWHDSYLNLRPTTSNYLSRDFNTQLSFNFSFRLSDPRRYWVGWVDTNKAFQFSPGLLELHNKAAQFPRRLREPHLRLSPLLTKARSGLSSRPRPERSKPPKSADAGSVRAGARLGLKRAPPTPLSENEF